MTEHYCDLHKCNFISFCGFMKCPLCNWEQQKKPSLEDQIIALTDMYKSVSIQCVSNHEYKLRQIDENARMSKRIDKIESLAKFNMSPEVHELFNFQISEINKKISDHEEAARIHKGIFLEVFKKIEELEKQPTDSLASWNLLEDRISDLEDWTRSEEDNIHERIGKLVNRIENLEDFIRHNGWKI